MDTEYPGELQELLNDLRCTIANICYLYLTFFECSPRELNNNIIIGYCSHMRLVGKDVQAILNGLERLTAA